MDTDKQKVITFVKDYNANRASSLKSVKKAESEYSKANKKKSTWLQKREGGREKRGRENMRAHKCC